MRAAPLLLAAALAALPSTAPAQEAPAAPFQSQDGEYFGLAFGTGIGQVMVGSTTTDVRDLVPGASPTTLALIGRYGHRTGDQLLGIQLGLVSTQWSGGGATASMNLLSLDFTYTAVVLDDVYLRLGAGPASLTFEGNGASSKSYGGAEMTAGIGISSGGFGVGIDFLVQRYGGDAPIDGASYVLATLTLGSL